ncbi:MAG: M28 family peptidase [Gemmatimonadaceae bacterium]|nr:M28 family peptidase [Gemmatimonadaceae bacterium]
MRPARLLTSAFGVGLFVPQLLSAQRPAVNQYGNPEKMRPAPTTGAITVRDLQTRLYQFADDSMQGRQVGRAGNEKGTNFIAAELKRLGVQPAGVNGTYFQNLPFHTRRFTDHSRVTVNGNPLQWNTEVVAVPGQRAPRPVVDADVVFGGVQGDTSGQITSAQAAGKVVVLLANPAGTRGGQGQAFAVRPGFAPPVGRFDNAAAVVTVDLDALTPAQRKAINVPTAASQTVAPVMPARQDTTVPETLEEFRGRAARYQNQMYPQAALRMTRDAAAKLFGVASLDALSPGSAGGKVSLALDFAEEPTNWGRNVIGVIPGSDPKLKHQYLAVGAHNDHVGFAPVVDKDSVRAFNVARNKVLIANGMKNLGPDLMATIRVNMDSIRRIHPKPRLDSIRNGADDDGSGSMAVLEIAEAIMAMPVKPKRSVLFVWHTGEEAGLLGAAHFTQNPTVPIDSIVAQLNIDMIGRGRAEDLPIGGEDYVSVIGSLFDSKDLGEQVKAVNAKQSKPLKLDYSLDEPSQWSGYNNIYGRSDHFRYAQQGVPIAFFFTGLHGDYHQYSDEPEFIDYPHYARIANYIKDIAIEVANGPRPRLNGTKPVKPKTIVP